MRNLIIIQAFILITATLSSQITIESNVLPKVGEELEYRTFAGYEDTLSYAENGENIVWDFNDIQITGTATEIYQDINETLWADTFPDADMIVDFTGFPAVAKRYDDRIAILDIIAEGFGGFGFDAEIQISDEFIVQSTPMTYGTYNEDDLEIVATIDASLLPFLDSIDLSDFGIIGELESLRITVNTTEIEDVVGWGQVNILNEERAVLKVKEEQISDTKVELGLNVFGFPLWLDVGEIFGNDPGGGGPGGLGGFGGMQSFVTYKFLAADSKMSIVEFTENRFQDTLGINMLTVSGRVSGDIIAGTDNLTLEDADYTVFPNPASGHLIIANEDETGESISVDIFSMMGQLLQTSKNYVIGDPLTLLSLDNGQYLLRVRRDERVLSSRFVIQR